MNTTRPISRSDLVALLAGDAVCRHCGGRGKITVTNERDHRTCPMCRGSGLTKSAR